MTKRSLLALTTAGLMTALPAMAQVAATTATDLNLRSGPGGDQQIVGVIPSGGEVTVDGCLDAANWCQVTYDGTQGWAYGDYLTAAPADATQAPAEPVVIYANRQQLQVPVVTVDNVETTSAETADAGAGAGAVAGAVAAATLVGGPAALIAGAALGAVAGDALTPESPEVTYVVANPAPAMTMGGEVIVGAGIPEGVELRPIPDSDRYAYLNVNGQPVIVDSSNRQIVYIVR
ncbi:hypothetical protein Rumeso_02283 [Rubellimicrobium mesophilum DSM 19309]|uniref:SH3b domain-containing protein n=1 Tax=Rubellimicrobium mesophilum DSM 19309 TaxID=442562 RepID=A0A017HQT2_9RHOB|nr:DUF1236 domain-containing protein [Rubellimicrobium mesophilum]EYD76094.1 hypothetical protein Rumeso_02283 [Rubellimicrobium mesophilum DSM 19309]